MVFCNIQNVFSLYFLETLISENKIESFVIKRAKVYCWKRKLSVTFSTLSFNNVSTAVINLMLL